MSRLNVLCIFTFCTCLAAKNPPTVTIPDQGTIEGKEVSRNRIQKIIGYYGIPYARPPVNESRFAPPITDPLPSWDGTRNATEYAPACLQTKEDYRKEAIPFLQIISNITFPMREDCLYLNVFVPYGNPAFDGFATIIWIHPGNYTTGSPAMWNPHTLVYRHRIIVVTIAWRLSIMGFFTSMDGEAPGNFGLMDQQAAMMWVKKNIKLFGGNPENICLMGYGTGAMSVGLHMINTNSRPLFNKAIAMSANFLSPSAVKYPKEDKGLIDTLVEKFGCNRSPTSQLMECLRNIDGQLLVQETSNINWRPLIDEGLSNNTSPFLPKTPKSFFEEGDFHKVPFLTGYTNMEEVLGIESLETDNLPANISNEYLLQILNEIVSGDIPNDNNSESCVFNHEHIYDAVTFFYGPTSNVRDVEAFRKIVTEFTTEKNYAASAFLHASYVSREQPTFVYRFDMKPITSWAIENIPEWVSVPHLFDLIYVWGVPYWSEYDGNNWELRDKRISDIIMSFWTNFAKSSDPTEGTLYPIRWDPFTKNNPGILLIDGSFNMSNSRNLNYKAFEFWNEFYPKVVQIATQCCNATDSAPIITELPHLWLLIIQMSIYFIHHL